MELYRRSIWYRRPHCTKIGYCNLLETDRGTDQASNHRGSIFPYDFEHHILVDRCHFSFRTMQPDHGFMEP